MSLALSALTAMTLLLCGAVAALPLLRELEPRTRALPTSAVLERIWIVRSGGDRWYLAGRPISRSDLGRRLQRADRQARIHLLPSSSLTLGEVSQALAWLRLQGPAAVQLELPPQP